jgi:hypothetical protein
VPGFSHYLAYASGYSSIPIPIRLSPVQLYNLFASNKTRNWRRSLRTSLAWGVPYGMALWLTNEAIVRTDFPWPRGWVELLAGGVGGIILAAGALVCWRCWKE